MGFLSSLFGSSKSQPRTTTTITTPKLPPEIAPKVEEIADEAKRLYEQRVAEGYVPYEGATIAPFTEQELAAQAGIEGLVGTSAPLQQEALAITRQQGERFTPEVAQEFMNPYQQAVIDIEKREAQKDFESRIMPEFEKQAASAGGLSGLGSRAGVQAALLGETQLQRLGDIQARGLQQAYDRGRQEFGAQKARERLQATDIGRAGPAMFASGLAEQGALAGIGEERRGLAQEALDEAYFRFLEEREEPARALAQYSDTIYGNPLASLSQTSAQTTTPGIPGQSTGSQLLGLGLQAASTYYGGGFGPVVRKEGGRLNEGLSGMVYRQQGSVIGMVPRQKQNAMEENPYGVGLSSEDVRRFRELGKLASDLRNENPPRLEEAARVQATMRRPALEGPSIVIDNPTTRSGRRAKDLALGLSGVGMPTEDRTPPSVPAAPTQPSSATPPAARPATPPAPATTGLASIGDTDMRGYTQQEARSLERPMDSGSLVRQELRQTLGELGREDTVLDRTLLAARAKDERRDMLAKQRTAEQTRFDQITDTQKKRLADQYALRRQEIEGRDWNMTLSKAFGVAAQSFTDPNKSLVEQISAGLGGMNETMVAERLLQRDQLSELQQEEFDKETAIIDAQLANQLAVLKENNKQDFNLLNLDLQEEKELIMLPAEVRSAVLDDAAKLAGIVDDITSDMNTKTGKLDTYYKMAEQRIYKEQGVIFNEDGIALLNNRPLTSQVAAEIEAKIRVSNEKLLKEWLRLGGTDVAAAQSYAATFPANAADPAGIR